jgi:HK97 family phage portal protein
VAVLERGMKFHELGLSNKDSQFIEARKAKEEEIAGIFRVPPHKIGELARSTNNNIEHQGIEFWTDTMLPWSTMWQSSISFFLLGPDEELSPTSTTSR